MRGYYYDQNRVYPVRPSKPPRRPWRAVLLLACTLLLLAGAGLCLRILLDMGANNQALASPAPTPGYSREEEWLDWWEEQEASAETTVERAPTGGQATLTLLPQPEGEPHSFQEIYQENIQSIVSIWGESDRSYSFGTGVVLTEDGYVITNAHVIQGCSGVEVTLQDDRSYKALLVGMDSQSDLAVLKIDTDGLRPAILGDSALLEVGDSVVAIGNPLGQELRGTMTDGIVSAINRDVSVDGYTMSLIQTTAALNSGNSGGALINRYGQVVGITNMKMYAYDDTVEGLGFAIPTATVKAVADVLIRDGVVTGRPSIGITCYTVTEEMAEAYEIPVGVCVDEVKAGSDAEAQGILPGDVIVKANGLTVTDIDQLLTLKEGLKAGDTLELVLWREGEYLDRTITLVEQYVLDGDGP